MNGQNGIAAKTFTPALMMDLKDESLEKAYDPEKARMLLRDASIPDSFATMLLLNLIRRPYIPNPIQIAEDIKADLSAAKIKVTIIYPKIREEYGIKVLKGDYDLVLYGWLAETMDPNDFLTALLASQSINISNISR